MVLADTDDLYDLIHQFYFFSNSRSRAPAVTVRPFRRSDCRQTCLLPIPISVCFSG